MGERLSFFFVFSFYPQYSSYINIPYILFTFSRTNDNQDNGTHFYTLDKAGNEKFVNQQITALKYKDLFLFILVLFRMSAKVCVYYNACGENRLRNISRTPNPPTFSAPAPPNLRA